MADGARSMENIFSSLCENLQLVVKQLQEGESGRPPAEDFTLDSYWTKMGMIIKAVSLEATKLCMAFSKPPLPSNEEVTGIVNGVEKAVLSLVSAFYSLPKDKGLTMRKAVNSGVRRIIIGMLSLVNSIMTDGMAGSQSQLQATGNVWQCCEEIPEWPKDNRQAVLLVFKDTSDLVKDAQEELEETIKDDTDGCWNNMEEILESEGHHSNSEDAWTEADKSLLSPCQGLLKATRSCLKKGTTAIKNNGQCDTDGNVSQLDDLADMVQGISPAVDDFVACLYAPMRHELVKENALLLSNVLKQFLEIANMSHITTEDDQPWVEFLLKAVQHNQNRIEELAVT